MTEHKVTEHKEWLDLVKKVYEKHDGKGGFQVLFPSYRPDMVHAVAHYLGLDFYDYREEMMLSQGWAADQISLDATTETLHKISAKSGVVVHNIEALLVTKPEDERQKWLTEFLSTDWKNAVVLPISIFQGETLEDHERVCDIELIPFPKQSFLTRLAM